MLKEFFADERVTMPFKLFGITHIGCMLLVLIGTIIIILLRGKIRNINEKTTRKILVISAIIMLINMILFNIGFIYYGVFDWKIHLPLHLCFISGYIFMVGVFFKKDNILKTTFFLSVLGPLPAIIWPEFRSTFNSFEFYEYFFSHHFFLLVSLFSYFALNLKIEKKDVFKAFGVSLFIGLVLMPFNAHFGTNYTFSTEIPQVVVNTLPFLKYFHPIIILLVLAVGIMTIMYFLAKKWQREI